MTDQHQHRATPEQWALTDLIELRDRIQSLETHIAVIEPLVARTQAATGSALHLAAETSKLGHRVEALEAAQHAHAITGPTDQLHSYKVGPAEPVEDWDKGHTLAKNEPNPPAANQVLALQDQIRDGSLTLAEALKKINGEPIESTRRTTYLVEKIRVRMIQEQKNSNSWQAVASAVLRDVAEWLRSEYPQREGFGTAAWANLLDNEANR